MAIDYADPFGRTFRTLRLSLTQACNFSCLYCVPANVKLRAEPDELLPEAFHRLTRWIVKEAGIEKIRLTGGEPLVYRHFDELAPKLRDLPVEETSCTTNGALLERKLPILERAGFKRINLSMDSLRPGVFKKFSRGGNLERVLRGIEATLKAGIKMKINVVPMRRQNLDELVPILEFCLEKGIECRYIELMKMGHVGEFFEAEFVGMEEILELVSRKYRFEEAEVPLDSTAVRFSVAGGGSFGVIPNASAPFCRHCSRLRLSSTGKLYGCLSNIANHSVGHLSEMEEEKARRNLRELLPKTMQSKQIAFQGAETYMQAIGG